MRKRIIAISLLLVFCLVGVVSSTHVYRRSVVTSANFKLWPTNPDSIVNAGTMQTKHLTVSGKTSEGIEVAPDTLRLWTWVAKADEDSTMYRLYNVTALPSGVFDSTVVATAYLVTSAKGGWFVTTFAPTAGMAIGSLVSVQASNLTTAADDTNIYINSYLEALNY